MSTYVTKLIRTNCQLSMLGLPGLCITHPPDAGRALVWSSFLAEVQCSMNTVVQPSAKTRILICARCRTRPTKPCSAQTTLCWDISNVLYQVFDADTVLVLVGGFSFPWLIGSGLDVSKVTPHCPGATGSLGAAEMDDPHLHLMLYVTSEPFWSWGLQLCSRQCGCRTELQLLKLKLGLCRNFKVRFPELLWPVLP